MALLILFPRDIPQPYIDRHVISDALGESVFDLQLTLSTAYVFQNASTGIHSLGQKRRII